MTRYDAGLVFLARCGLLWGLVLRARSCVTDSGQALSPPPPYMLLPTDEMMSCNAMPRPSISRRACRSPGILDVGGAPKGYGSDEFPRDAPRELVDERRRLDALTDLQRYKGCFVLEPGPSVVYERSKLEGSMKAPQSPVILKSRD